MKNYYLNESDITKIIKNSIEKKLLSENFNVEPEVEKQPREYSLDKVFGKYEFDIPDDVIRYMRKNPRRIIDRLIKIYGEEKFMNYVDLSLSKSGSSGELKEGGSADMDEDGVITPYELYEHFDVNGDGIVTMEDYVEHIDFHCSNPDKLDKFRA